MWKSIKNTESKNPKIEKTNRFIKEQEASILLGNMTGKISITGQLLI